MRVLIITPLYPPAIGGAATYFGDIVPRLAHHDAIQQLVVLTERIPNQPRQSVSGKLHLVRDLPTRVSAQRPHRLGHAMTYMLTQLWFAVRLPALVRRQRIELIHFHTRYRGRLFRAALRRTHTLVIADLRDKLADPEWLADVAGRLLCCAEGVQRFAIQGGFPADRTVLIPIPFTPPEIPSPAQVFDAQRRYGLSGAPYVLFVGDITYNKGACDLLAAYRQWRLEHPQVGLVFTGVNREGQRFLSQVRQTAGAIYLGHMPRPDVVTLMRGAKVVALPSRSEGLPRVILEAVALGTKVLCPPAIPEFEKHLPQCVLPEVSVESIITRLNTIWHASDQPVYPFAAHRVCGVVENLVDVYREVI